MTVSLSISPRIVQYHKTSQVLNQLLSITYQIYKCFDDGQEVRYVFLDISKAFDKVWHKGLIFKLKENGISGNLLNALTDF